MKKNKYSAIKVKEDGYIFDSKAEHRRYKELLILQRAGEIKDLELQPKYECVINGKKIANVILDFRYFDNGKNMTVIQDVKGFDTTVSRLKRKLVEAIYNITVEIIKR